MKRLRKNNDKPLRIFLTALGLCLVAGMTFLFQDGWRYLMADIFVNDSEPYFWSEGWGWIRGQEGLDLSQATQDEDNYGVHLSGDDYSGYLWSENIGWIALRNDTGAPITFGVSKSGTGLIGYAWAENGGWLKFDHGTAGYEPVIDVNGDWRGYVWAENGGWLLLDESMPGFNTLNVTVVGNGSVDSSPSGIIDCTASTGTCSMLSSTGAVVVLTADPNSGNYFDSWTGCDSSNGNQCTVTVDTDPTAVTATFAAPAPGNYILEITSTAHGTVTSNTGSINCDNGIGVCSAYYASGTAVTLTGTPDLNYAFGSWGGDCSGTGSACLLTMTANHEVSATYTISPTGDIGVDVHVGQSLVLTIDDTSILLSVDPSLNDGRDYSQKNMLMVATNAIQGYVIQAKLENSSGTAALQNSDTKSTIVAGNAVGSENRFGYLAYNSDITATQGELLTYSSGSTSYMGTSSSNLKLPDNSDVSYVGVTNEQRHTVYYALNVDFTTYAGTYVGTITYTAVPSF